MRIVKFILILLLLNSCKVVSHKKDTAQSSEENKEYIQKFHQGLRAKLRGQLDEAIELFLKASEIAPAEDAPHFALAQSYLMKNDIQNASISTKNAADRDPLNTWYLQELAYMYKELNDEENATKIYKQLLKLQPHKAEWLFEYASLLEKIGKISEAIEMLTKTENEIGVNTSISIRKFYLYLKLKNEKDALATIEKAKQKFPKDARLIATEIDYYFETKQDVKAFQTMESLVAADPSNGNAHKLLGDYYFRTNQKEKGIQEFVAGIKCDLSLDDRMKMAIQLFDVNTPDSIMEDLVNYITEVFPDNAKSYTFKGDFLQRINNNKEALRAYKKALEYDKSKYLIWQEVLLLDYEEKNFADLKKDAMSCLELFPTVANVYLMAGLASNQLKKYDEAIELVTNGMDFVKANDPLLAEFHGQLGESYFGKKEIGMAIDNYNTALEIDPKNIILKNNFAYRLAFYKKDLSLATRLINEVVGLNSSSKYRDTQGYVFFQDGKYAEALAIFLAIYTDQADNMLTEHLGDAFFKTGDKKSALKYWIKASDLGSKNKVLNDKIEKIEYYEPQY
ncbi:MAG: tetratricopeptide repeat protein [Crocinitomicaceae bacterium]|nr:tetratricopeptide repeat protein [Crocinitomicaceae bacterium]